VEPAQIFISYQWDNQDEVTVLRDVLEKNGFTCWMDIGQMGGGDHLYNCIYDGVKNAKVNVCYKSSIWLRIYHGGVLNWFTFHLPSANERRQKRGRGERGAPASVPLPLPPAARQEKFLSW